MTGAEVLCGYLYSPGTTNHQPPIDAAEQPIAKHRSQMRDSFVPHLRNRKDQICLINRTSSSIHPEMYGMFEVKITPKILNPLRNNPRMDLQCQAVMDTINLLKVPLVA